VLDLAEAEVAFRRGRDREAEALAVQASRLFEAAIRSVEEVFMWQDKLRDWATGHTSLLRTSG
jgi:hypothetical protein